MKFSSPLTAIALIAFASSSFALPTSPSSSSSSINSRSLITEVGGLVQAIENGLGITAIEDELNTLLGGGLTELENKLGTSFAEDLLHLSNTGASPGDLQAVGKGIYYLEEGLGVNAIDAFLDKETGGAITSIEKALGVTDIEKALGIEA